MMLRLSALFALLCASAAFAQTPAQTTAPTPAEAAPAATPAQDQQSAQPAAPEAPPVVGSATIGPAAERLIVTDNKVGTGREAIVGSTVFVHYTG